jgi:hypothetical protein
MTIPYVARPGLLAVGVLVIIVGWMLRSWASRHSLIQTSIKGAALGAANSLRKGEAPGLPSEIGDKIGAVMNQASNVGKAKVVAGYAVKGWLATIVGPVGWLTMLAGLMLGAAGIFWK